VHRYLKLKTQLTLVLEHWTHEMEASSPFIGFITQKWSTKKSTTPNWTMFIHVYGWYMAGNHQPTWVTGRVGPRVGPPTWCHPLPGAKRRCSWSLTWASSQVEFRGKMRRNQWILLSHDGSMVLLYIYYYIYGNMDPINIPHGDSPARSCRRGLREIPVKAGCHPRCHRYGDGE
jgi:hypothetical protein